MDWSVATTATQALWLLPFALPVCLWVAWSDMKFMLIPNKAVLTLLGIWAVVGFFAFPLDQYGWRWMHFIYVICAGFLLNSAGLVGAGDAKFAAAMAPFVAGADLIAFLFLFCAVMLAAWLAHRIGKHTPVIRAATPDWQSWEQKKDFPMGLALAGSLILYLVLGITVQ